MLARTLRRAFLGIAVTAAVSGSAVAAPLSRPSLSILGASRTSVTAVVTAGESGAPAGFTLEWMKASEYDALGSWPSTEDSRLHRGVFVGVPTLNTTDGTHSYQLESDGAAGVELGDLFDETGVLTAQSGELEEGTEYVVRAIANSAPEGEASEPSAPVRIATALRSSQDCTYTQGYWKTHETAWPTGSLTLGTVNYSAAQLLLVFHQPAAGNGLVSLAHQLIAAKLNIANGATAPAAVLLAINQADALIGALVAPPIGAGTLSPASTSALTNTLDQFNNGVTGPGHCGSTPAKRSTWGAAKQFVR
ncbi:MAG: hypothetical protein IT348_12840 [Candidatus Eisenbacteria bacterium]|nr:hypothetical protein [Candidatus Eisenbacteria bacterium]